jgi:DinB superfamily
MDSVANDLSAALKIADQLRAMDEASVSKRPAPGKWSKKEILGHLIDSATNNHQRFVRLQLNPTIDLPGYEQDDWVRLQRYQDQPWRQIVDLWQTTNNHLVSLIRHVNPDTLPHIWRRPDGSELTLEFIIRDYVVHLRHHLDQIL